MKVLFPYFNIVFLFLCLGVCSLTATQDIYLNDVHIETYSGLSKTIDINMVIESSSLFVKKNIPNSHLSHLAFRGKCSKLEELQGELILGFFGTKQRFVFENEYSTILIINTSLQKASIHVRDVTGNYFSRDSLSYQNKEYLSINEIARLANKYANQSSFFNCNARLTRLKDVWLLEFTQIKNQTHVHKVSIDLINGDLVKKANTSR